MEDSRELESSKPLMHERLFIEEGLLDSEFEEEQILECELFYDAIRKSVTQGLNMLKRVTIDEDIIKDVIKSKTLLEVSKLNSYNCTAEDIYKLLVKASNMAKFQGVALDYNGWFLHTLHMARIEPEKEPNEYKIAKVLFVLSRRYVDGATVFTDLLNRVKR
jgi:hypothetical protein